MITFDLTFYWMAVAAVLVTFAAQWGFRRLKSTFGR